MRTSKIVRAALLSIIVASTSGCMPMPRYTTDISEARTIQPMDQVPAPKAWRGTLRPIASFPAVIAVLELTSPKQWNEERAMGIRTEEESADLRCLDSLPRVQQLSMINPMHIQWGHPQSYYSAARSMNADILILYQVRSGRVYHGVTIPLLGVLTLGLFPNEYRQAFATASALILDARTGYLYGTIEMSSSAWRLANGWTGDDQDDSIALRARQHAIADFGKALPQAWERILKKHDPYSIGQPACVFEDRSVITVSTAAPP